MNYNVYVYGFSRICFTSDLFEDQCKNYVPADLPEQVHSGTVRKYQIGHVFAISWMITWALISYQLYMMNLYSSISLNKFMVVITIRGSQRFRIIFLFFKQPTRLISKPLESVGILTMFI